MKYHTVECAAAFEFASLGVFWFAKNDGAALADLRQRLVDIEEHSKIIKAKAEAEKRDFTEEEQVDLDKLFNEFDVVEADIERHMRIQAQEERLARSSGRRTTAEGPGDEDEEEGEIRNSARSAPIASQRQGVGRNPRRQTTRFEVPENRGTWGWRDQGEFFCAVATAGLSRGATMDNRLLFRNAATTYGQEQTGQDGGFAVPPDFRQAIMSKVSGEDSLLPRTDQLTSSSNVASFPIDNISPWDSTSGIQAYWDDEASTATQSKPALEEGMIKVQRIRTLVPVTEELLEDAPGMTAFIQRKAPEKINMKINIAIVSGNGVARPLGILPAPATISVAKEASQAAATFVAENALKMWGRMYGPCRSRAVWLYNQDLEQQLYQMNFKIKNVAGTENVGGMPVFVQPGGLSGSPYAMLLGRPMIPTEACNTIGTQGDIILADLTQYMTILKVGGMKQDVSMHVYFEQNMMAFRFTLRIGGRPWWPNAITRRSGSNTLSCFVTLDDRP